MSVKGKPVPGPAPMLKNVGAAPLVYFDSVPVFGTAGGIIEIELSARMLLPRSDNSVLIDMGCTGHLRCSPSAAMVLIDSLTKVLDMVAKQQEPVSELLKN